MINLGGVIKHRSFKDVACVVRGWDGDQLCVEWINQGFVKSWSLGKYSTITFNESEWLVCITPSPKCYRYAVWRSI